MFFVDLNIISPLITNNRDSWTIVHLAFHNNYSRTNTILENTELSKLILLLRNLNSRSKHYIRLLFHFTQAKASRQIPKDKTLHHSKCLLIMWNISNFDAKFWLFCFTELLKVLKALWHSINIKHISYEYLSV
jgi:hypothetical protein